MPATIKPILSRCSDLIVAIAAINGSVAARFKGYFGVFATGCALYREHLPVTTGFSITVRLPCLAACGTSFWLIGIAFSLEKFLFIRTKGEWGAAIGTVELFVLKTHVG
jgi:hypothetical protein